MADINDQTETVGGLRELMRGFVRERAWEKYHTPRNLAASVSVEAGELLELFQWLTPEEAAHKSKEDQEFRQAVGEELADVLMYLMSLANALDLDVASTVHDKMRKNRLKYPADQFQGHYQRPLKPTL
jgi:NTP pyrophosphatase (non-canonical NTP hydrolase)